MTNRGTPDRARAERAVHERMRLACDAAADAAVPGVFRVWEDRGLLAVSASHPELGFLSTVSGVTAATLPDAIGLARAPDWPGRPPVLVLPADLAAPAGMRRAADRVIAVRPLVRLPASGQHVVATTDVEGFLDVLLAGYEARGVVAAFIRAEHRSPAVLRFLAVHDGQPIGAAAMTVHDDVAVLGGAATLPAHRGRGAQSHLLAQRLAAAARAGCILAVATARPGSTSAANLERAGFTLLRRTAWTA